MEKNAISREQWVIANAIANAAYATDTLFEEDTPINDAHYIDELFNCVLEKASQWQIENLAAVVRRLEEKLSRT